jgi:hypothetical protein
VVLVEVSSALSLGLLSRGFLGEKIPSNRFKTVSEKPKPKPDDPAQYKRFLEAAREAQADETEEGADKAFKKVVIRKPK